MTIPLAVLAGVSTFVLGQLALKLLVDPVHELKRTIADIAVAIIKYAGVYSNPGVAGEEREKEAARELRALASKLNAQMYLVPRYPMVHWFFGLPAKSNISQSMRFLIGISNGVHKSNSDMGTVNAEKSDKVCDLLGIHVADEDRAEAKPSKRRQAVVNARVMASGFFVIGIAVGAVLTWWWSHPRQADWLGFENAAPQSLQLAEEAVFPSSNDVGMVWRVVSLRGRATFVEALNGTPALQLGYMLSVDLENVTPEGFPMACRRRLPTSPQAERSGNEIVLGALDNYDMTAPIHEISLRVVPNFELKDQNGFELASVDGVEHALPTGGESTVQAVASMQMPESFRSRAAKLDVKLKAYGVGCDG